MPGEIPIVADRAIFAEGVKASAGRAYSFAQLSVKGQINALYCADSLERFIDPTMAFDLERYDCVQPPEEAAGSSAALRPRHTGRYRSEGMGRESQH